MQSPTVLLNDLGQLAHLVVLVVAADVVRLAVDLVLGASRIASVARAMSSTSHEPAHGVPSLRIRHGSGGQGQPTRLFSTMSSRRLGEAP